MPSKKSVAARELAEAVRRIDATPPKRGCRVCKLPPAILEQLVGELNAGVTPATRWLLETTKAKTIRRSHVEHHRSVCFTRQTVPVEPDEGAAGVAYAEQGNEASASWADRCPRTLDELLVACAVDQTTWEVERWVANSWPVGAKINNQIRRTPLYQVKAWLRKRVLAPVALAPVRPVEVTVRGRERAPRPPASILRAVVWPDMQVGFRRDLRTGALDPLHDRAAIDVALQITEAIRPDRVVFLGDNHDMTEWSEKYVTSPEFYDTTQPAVLELAHWYGRVRAISPEIEIDVIEGNHDYRLLKAIQINQRAAYQLRPADDVAGHALMSMPRLLGLDALDIRYHGPYPSGEVWLNDNLRLVHGEIARGRSGATAAAMLDDLRHSEGQGHIHRVELACKTLWSVRGPKFYMAFSPGTLARIEPGIVPGFKHRQNWQQGVAVIEYEPGDGAFGVYPVFIHNGRAIYGGRSYEARPFAPTAERIYRDTGYRVA